MRIESSSPRTLLSSLSDLLTEHKVTMEEAAAVRGAVQGLSPDAPLTISMIESLKLSPGVTGALVFTWLRHKYPDLIKQHARGQAETAADVVRSLLWEEKKKAPEFAVEFHRALTTQPELERDVEVVALEVAIAKAESLTHVAESPEKILLELKPPNLDPALAAFFPNKTTLRLVEDQGRWEAQWDLNGQTYFNYLDALPPAALEQIERALKAAKKSLALGDRGVALLAALPELRAAYNPPAHPALRTIETFLRFALGAHRVGETEIDILNELIESMVQGSQQLLSGASIGTSVLTLGDAKDTKAAIDDPLQRIFGVSKRTPPPPPDPAKEEEAPARPSRRRQQPPKGTPPAPSDGSGGDEDFLISDLKRAFAPDGPNADLIPYVKTVEDTLLRMSKALMRIRERLGARSISVRLDNPDSITKGRV